MGNAVVLQVPSFDEFRMDAKWMMFWLEDVNLSCLLQIGRRFGHLYSIFAGVSLEKLWEKDLVRYSPEQNVVPCSIWRSVIANHSTFELVAQC